MSATRRGLGLALLGTGVLLSASGVAASAVPVVLVEQTYLKAKPGQRAALAAFIIANWFAMDAEGIRRGIFVDYRLFEAIDDNPEWDFVVAVGYPQAGGYEQPATKASFDAIRAAHTAVPAGAKLADFGSIVGHHRLRVTAGSAT